MTADSTSTAGLIPVVNTPPPAGTNILTVGVGEEYSTVADAINASQDGDVIQVDAGTYTNDFATITHKITIEGVGGMVNMVATVPPPNEKGILVVDNDVTIENMTFSGAAVSDADGGNGAGIRYEGGQMVLINDAFIGNQDGVMGNPVIAGLTNTVTIDHSLFSDNGSGSGYTHNLYIGPVDSLTVTNSVFEDAQVGHELKSRALANTLQNNVFADGPTGTASYDIDLPNGGVDLIQNNVIEKGPLSQQVNMVHFGGEGTPYADSSLTVTGNSFINDRTSGTVGVLNQTDIPATITDNNFSGITAANVASGPAVETDNTFNSGVTVSITPVTSVPITIGATVPVSTEPTTPVSTEPTTPVSTEPTTPVSTEPTTPVSTEPTTPVSTKPTTPVSTEPTTPVSTEPTTPVSTDPTTPVSTEPTTPVSAEPTTPVSTEPTTPVTTEPTTPVTTEPTTPVISNPKTPVASDPTTPVASDPTTPAASDPTTPVASDPTTPVASDPTTPVASDPTTPVASDPSTPVASDPTTPVASDPTTQIPSGNWHGQSTGPHFIGGSHHAVVTGTGGTLYAPSGSASLTASGSSQATPTISASVTATGTGTMSDLVAGSGSLAAVINGLASATQTSAAGSATLDPQVAGGSSQWLTTDATGAHSAGVVAKIQPNG